MFVSAISFLAGRAQQIDQRSAYVLFDTSPVALTHVRVIDGSGAPPKVDQTIIIEGGSIESIGDADKVVVPGTARSLYLRGTTVLPGLVMVHEHFMYHIGDKFNHAQPFSFLRLYLAYGVTTVRTAGTDFPYLDLNLRQEIASGRVPGPEIHVTGPYFDGMPPQFFEGLWGTKIVRDAEDGRRAVAYWAAEGVTSFKLYKSISKAAAKAIIDEAHRHRLMVTGHLGSLTCEEAADLGIDNIEHATRCAREARANGPSAEYALMRTLAQSKVALTMTLNANNRPLSDRELEFLHPDARDAYVRSAAERREVPGAGTFTPLYREFMKSGGLLVLGSDAGGSPGWGWFAGPSNHRAVETLVETVGFSPAEAIRIATLNGATLLRIESRVGTVVAGKQADLFVVRGNPAVSIRDIENVEIVFRNGVAYDPNALRVAVKGQVGWH